MRSEAKRLLAYFPTLHPDQRLAAENLIHYLVLRNDDIRSLQEQLHLLGLSSLSSAESHVLSQVQAVLARLGQVTPEKHKAKSTFQTGKARIQQTGLRLFGLKTEPDIPHIMVTLDASFADNYLLIKDLLSAGMNVARINCAHDDETVWHKLILNLKKACRNTGKRCKVYMDLAGPKIRTKLLAKGSTEGKVKVQEGDMIWLAETDEGCSLKDVVISPDEPGIIEALKKGERVLIDDGVIEAVVEKVKKNKTGIRIVRISSPKKRIKNEKGINFPDSDLQIPSLTAFDRQCLGFVAQNADLIGYSFVRTGADVAALQDRLNELSRRPPGIILKIETPEAVINLPGLLLQGMTESVFGVMIARGDLAVEIGFERMGEIQDEILWICEAAHVPVVWATQVLDTLNKTGIATRSEITDAGHAALAECVMVNKGEHTLKVLETLRDILRRSAEHRVKKRYTLRPLGIAGAFINAADFS